MVRRVQLGLRADFDPAVQAIADVRRPSVALDDAVRDKLVSTTALEAPFDDVRADPVLHALVVEQINALDAGSNLQVTTVSLS